MPDTAPEPPTRSPSSGSFLANKGRKMYNFFGHRPPSELIANHLGEYFPAAKKRELQRHSMLRMSKVSSGRGSFETMDRRSIIDSSPRRHMVIPEEGEVSVPRVSVSNDSGANIPPQIDDPSRPPLLPPFEPSSESLSDSLGAYSPTAEKITTERPLRPKSIMLNSRRGSTGSNKSRMSTLSQLRRNRDRSDTASLLTVDEITAEVENRRASTITFDESDDEDITGGSVPPPVEPGLAPKNDESDSEEGDDEEEDDSESESESESEGESDASESSDDHGKAYTSTGCEYTGCWRS
jgi:mitogen-activated protein kinase kinase kinase